MSAPGPDAGLPRCPRIVGLPGQSGLVLLILNLAGFVMGFGRRPYCERRDRQLGRRPKAAKEGTREILGTSSGAGYGDLVVVGGNVCGWRGGTSAIWALGVEIGALITGIVVAGGSGAHRETVPLKEDHSNASANFSQPNVDLTLWVTNRRRRTEQIWSTSLP
jgi:hypothetical protein